MNYYYTCNITFDTFASFSEQATTKKTNSKTKEIQTKFLDIVFYYNIFDSSIMIKGKTLLNSLYNFAYFVLSLSHSFFTIIVWNAMQKY